MDPYDEIRARVSCLDAARQYGLEVRRNGFCLCPFHNDKKPSLKLYDGDRGFFCFSCNEAGDVIKLTGQLLGLDRKGAARQLNRDFALHLPIDRPPDRAEREQAQHRRKVYSTAADFQEWKESMERLITDVYRLGWMARRDLPATLWLHAEIDAIKLLPTLNYWLDMLGGDTEQQVQIFRERKQVERACRRILNAMPERFRED